MMAFVF